MPRALSSTLSASAEAAGVTVAEAWAMVCQCRGLGPSRAFRVMPAELGPIPFATFAHAWRRAKAWHVPVPGVG